MTEYNIKMLVFFFLFFLDIPLNKLVGEREAPLRTPNFFFLYHLHNTDFYDNSSCSMQQSMLKGQY